MYVVSWVLALRSDYTRLYTSLTAFPSQHLLEHFWVSLAGQAHQVPSVTLISARPLHPALLLLEPLIVLPNSTIHMRLQLGLMPSLPLLIGAEALSHC